MTETQATICTWADTTFGPPVSDASIAARALVEMAELVTACVNGEPAERIGEEIADVVIVLARLGRALGIDVIGYIKWQYDAGLGTVEQDAASAAVWLTEAALSVTLGDSFEARANVLRLARDLRILADRVSINLPAAIDAKMAINRARQWVLDGHGSHVREVTP